MRSFYNPDLVKDGMAADQIITSGRQKPLGTLQSIHEASTVQNYDIGTRMVMDDRVFRYCYAKLAVEALLGCRADVMPREGEGDAVQYEVGDYEVTIPMNANGPSVDYAAEVVEDYWAEGYYWSGIASPTVGQMYRIKSSATATTTGRITSLTGGFVTATLYEPLVTQIPASRWQTSWVNPYKSCVHTHSGKMSVIAQPLISVAAGSYFWGQTWGPSFGQLNSSAIGRTASDRMVYWMSDGSLGAGVVATYTTGSPHLQCAGFVITNTAAWTNAGGSGESGGDQFIMLQISP